MDQTTGHQKLDRLGCFYQIIGMNIQWRKETLLRKVAFIIAAACSKSDGSDAFTPPSDEYKYKLYEFGAIIVVLHHCFDIRHHCTDVVE